MKFYSVLITFILLFSSCSKGEPDASISTFTANVNGEYFVSSRVDTRLDTSITMSSRKQLTLAGMGNFQSIVIILTDYDESSPLGTYYISNGRAIARFNSGSAQEVATSGQVEVTSASRSLINGSVAFTTPSGLQVTDGKFSVVIQP